MNTQIHIRRDDGRFLTGPGATETSDKPQVPFQDLQAAMAAIDHYRIVCAVYAPDAKKHSFTLIHVSDYSWADFATLEDDAEEVQ